MIKRIKVAEDAEFIFEPIEGGLKITVMNPSGVQIVFHQTLEQVATLGNILRVFATKRAA